MAAGDSRKILIIVENLPVPFDTRVWQEATTLVQNGYTLKEYGIYFTYKRMHDGRKIILRYVPEHDRSESKITAANEQQTSSAAF